MFIAALLMIVNWWKQPKFSSTNKWLNKIWYIHKIEYYSATKMNEILTHTSIWMKHETIVLSERSQTRKATYYIIPLT